jgi:hypothetical protein
LQSLGDHRLQAQFQFRRQLAAIQSGGHLQEHLGFPSLQPATPHLNAPSASNSARQ